MESAPRTDAESNTIGADCSDDLVEKLESEASTILNAAAVLIRALVRDILQELVRKIPIRAMQLNPVETGFVHRVRSRLAIPADVLLDLYWDGLGECDVSWRRRTAR